MLKHCNRQVSTTCCYCFIEKSPISATRCLKNKKITHSMTSEKAPQSFISTTFSRNATAPCQRSHDIRQIYKSLPIAGALLNCHITQGVVLKVSLRVDVIVLSTYSLLFVHFFKRTSDKITAIDKIPRFSSTRELQTQTTIKLPL